MSSDGALMAKVVLVAIGLLILYAAFIMLGVLKPIPYRWVFGFEPAKKNLFDQENSSSAKNISSSTPQGSTTSGHKASKKNILIISITLILLVIAFIFLPFHTAQNLSFIAALILMNTVNYKEGEGAQQKIISFFSWKIYIPLGILIAYLPAIFNLPSQTWWGLLLSGWMLVGFGIINLFNKFLYKPPEKNRVLLWIAIVLGSIVLLLLLISIFSELFAPT